MRVVDAVVMQSLSTSPSFFASTTILIIGGLLAALGTTEKASELVRDLPFAAQTSMLVFDLKLLLLLAIFVYALLPLHLVDAPVHLRCDAGGRCARGWSSSTLRARLPRCSAMPSPTRPAASSALAAETFNDGLRAYYFAFAAIGWFFSPLAFMVATVGVIYILYRREFRSEVLAVLNS